MQDIAPRAPPLVVPSERLDWIDAARCVGIVFVVLGHVVRGANEARLFADQDKFVLIDNLIYYFHMPLFFWLSGVTSSFATTEDRTWKAIGVRIVAPYVFWSVALVVVKSTFASEVNSPATFRDLFLIPYSPVGPFWFLYVLALMLALRHLLRAYDARDILLPLGLGLFVLRFSIDIQQPIAAAFCEFLIFFALGHADARISSGRERYSLTIGSSALAAFLALEATAGAHSVPYETLAGRLVGLACVPLLVILFRSDLVRPIAANGVVRFIGRATMPIYCVHVFFIGIVRSVLFRIHVDALPFHLLAGLAAGLALPLVMLWVCRYLSIDRFVPGFDILRPKARPNAYR